MRFLIIITILTGFCLSAVYPQGRISVVVFDDKGNPIPFASVFNSNTKNCVITNEEGRFEINAVFIPETEKEKLLIKRYWESKNK